MHFSCRDKIHVTLLHWAYVGEKGGRGGEGVMALDGDGGGSWMGGRSMSVVLLGVLEPWMCRGWQYCRGQWNMLKRTLPFRVAGVFVMGAHTHRHRHTVSASPAPSEYVLKLGC